MNRQPTARPNPAAPFAEQLAGYQARVEAALERWLPAAGGDAERLAEAMRYSALDGGKRVRPVLAYAAGAALGAAPAALDGCACAVEMIHVYSLVHDDLPAMDDDDLRRGRPACHRAYDEATAILVGDALQALAFQVLADDPAVTVSAAQRLKMISVLAAAAGPQGMTRGQAMDMNAVGKPLTVEQLRAMHSHKTGALIRAGAQLGALAAGARDGRRFRQLSRYADCIGLAFQIQDDVLNVESDTEILGKTQGSDAAMNKPTYPGLLGLDAAKQSARDLLDEALEQLADFDEKADALRQLAAYIVERDR